MNRFIKVYTNIVGHMNMPDKAFKILMWCQLLASYTDTPTQKRGQVFISHARLMRDIAPEKQKISTNTITDALRWLEAHNYITIERRKGRASLVTVCLYQEEEQFGGDRSTDYNCQSYSHMSHQDCQRLGTKTAGVNPMEESTTSSVDKLELDKENSRNNNIAIEPNRTNGFFSFAAPDAYSSNDTNPIDAKTENRKRVRSLSALDASIIGKKHSIEEGTATKKEKANPTHIVISIFSKKFFAKFGTQYPLSVQDTSAAKRIAALCNGESSTIDKYIEFMWVDSWIAERNAYTLSALASNVSMKKWAMRNILQPVRSPPSSVASKDVLDGIGDESRDEKIRKIMEQKRSAK